MALEAKVKLSLEDKVTQKLNQIFKKIHGIDAETYKMVNNTTKVSAKLKEVVNHAKKLKDQFKKNNTLVSEFGKKLAGIFSAYAGVMMIRAVVDTSDTITAAKNKLNYINGGDTGATADNMDKMFAAALRSRSDYQDLMNNVSKNMMLAPDAFQNNTDNAIRFQETMAKAYAISGAGAAEVSSSLYQLNQALGSGVLQGDELKSTAEGAQLAYQEVEKFAQALYNTDESLKDMGSKGMITSEVVVAAIMNATEEIDKAFEETDMGIKDVLTNIKSYATHAFLPIQDAISSFLNDSEQGEKLVNALYIAVQGLVGLLGVLLNAAIAVTSWIVDNWAWIQWIVYAVAIAVIYLAVVAIGQYLIKKILEVAVTGALAWLPWLFLIAAVISFIVLLANSAKSGCDFVYQLFYGLAFAIIALLAIVLIVFLATGHIMLSAPTLIVLGIIAVVALLVSAIAKYGEQIGAGIAAVASAIWNIFVTLVALVIQNALMPFARAWDMFANFFGNLFNDPIAAIIHTFETLANSVLGILKTIASGIDAIFGSNLAGTVQGWMDKVSGKADSLANKYGNGTYETKSDAVGALNDLMSGAVDKYTWDTSLAIQQGAAVGAGVQNGINSTFNKVKSGVSGFKNNIDEKIANSLNIDKNYDPNAKENQTNPSGYDPSALGKGVNNIDKNTGKVADSMEMADEDLKYLRDLAEQEWKKEYTTANITVDMNNYNTINGESDLDGIVTHLSERLYDEMDYLANGVYGR